MNNFSKKGMKYKLIDFGALPKSFIHKLYGVCLYKGCTFTLAHIAPLGCPIALQIGNTLLSIRLNEMNQMRLEAL